MLHDHPGGRTADHPGHRDGENEKRHDPPAHAVRKPEREIKNDTWKKAGFSRAKQDAGKIKLVRARYESHRHRGQAPQAHDPRDGLARADLLQNQIAWHLEQDIADVEQADPEPIAGVAQMQVALELQFGETDVDPVDVVQNIADEDKGDDPIDDLPVETMLVIFCDRWTFPPLQKPLHADR